MYEAKRKKRNKKREEFPQGDEEREKSDSPVEVGGESYLGNDELGAFSGSASCFLATKIKNKNP